MHGKGLLAAGMLLGITVTTTPALAQLQGKTIAIGVGGPLTGGSALLGVEQRQAVELAIEEQNAAGGILGARLVPVVADDKAAAPEGQAVARDFCANADLLGVVGHVNSGVTIQASEVYQGCGLPMITAMSSNPAVTDRGLTNVFRLTNRDDRKGPAIAAYLYRTIGKRKAVVMDDRTTYGQGVAGLFAQAFTREGGQVLARPGITVGEQDFRGVLGALPKDFDVLFFGGIAEAALVLKQMRATGLTQLFACGDGCWDVKGFIDRTDGAATAGEGVLVLSAAPAIGRVPGSTEFAARYAARYGPIASYAVNAYDSARLLMRAIQAAARARAGVPSRAEVLAQLRGEKFQGIAYARPVEWDAKGDNRAAVIFLNVVEGNRFKEIGEVGQDGSN